MAVVRVSKGKVALLRAKAVHFVLTFPYLCAEAFAAGQQDPISEMERKATEFITSAGKITRLAIVFGIAVAVFAIPVYIGLKTAFNHYQKQEQMAGAGGKVNWMSVVAHGAGAFVASSMIAALFVAVLDTLLGGSIKGAITSFFEGIRWQSGR